MRILVVGAGSTVAFGAIVGGRTVLGENVTIGAGAVLFLLLRPIRNLMGGVR